MTNTTQKRGSTASRGQSLNREPTSAPRNPTECERKRKTAQSREVFFLGMAQKDRTKVNELKTSRRNQPEKRKKHIGKATRRTEEEKRGRRSLKEQQE